MMELMMYPSALLRHLSGLAILGALVGAYLHSSGFPPKDAYFQATKNLFLHCFHLDGICPNWRVYAYVGCSPLRNYELNYESCSDVTCVKASWGNPFSNLLVFMVCLQYLLLDEDLDQWRCLPEYLSPMPKVVPQANTTKKYTSVMIRVCHSR